MSHCSAGGNGKFKYVGVNTLIINAILIKIISTIEIIYWGVKKNNIHTDYIKKIGIYLYIQFF